MSAYADDVMAIVNGQEDKQLVSVVNDFGIISAAKVNWEKTEALRVGKWEEELPKLPSGMIWKREGFKYLGEHIGDVNTQQKRAGKG